jgi:hypothetical protein
LIGNAPVQKASSLSNTNQASFWSGKRTERSWNLWHDLATARNQRSTRFRKSQQSQADNLYTEILQLLVVDQYRKAGRILDEHLSRDPLSGEAIVSWTELKLDQRKIKKERVMEYLEGLSGAFPEDPYYTLAKALVIARECYGVAGEVDPYVVEVERAASLAEYSSDVLADVLAKIAFNSASLGMWSFGMSYFIKAIKVKDKHTSAAAEPLILLSQKNEASVELYLKSLESLSGRVLSHSFNDVPLEVIVRTLCILLIAYEDLGICEAWPLATLLAHIREETAKEWANLTPLFSKYCSSWIQVQCMDGPFVCRTSK